MLFPTCIQSNQMMKKNEDSGLSHWGRPLLNKGGIDLRHQASFNIVDGELIVVEPKLFDRDLNFHFQVPDGYRPSDRLPELSFDDWRKRIEAAVLEGKMRVELAEKIFSSLTGLPDLQPNQQVGICFSGGKESKTITILSRIKYPKNRIFTMFADTKDEWPETYEFIPRFMKWAGIVDFRHLNSIGIHKLLEEKIPCWPIAGRRHCTKNLKMLPMRDHLDEKGFDQVRKDGKPARFRPTHEKQGELISVRGPAPLLISGERHMEGMGRSNLPVEPTRDELLMRVTARPVIEWSIIDIWEFLFWMHAPYNPVYHHVRRVACSGCPFASDEELYTLGKLHPDMLSAWVTTEEIIGHPRLGGKSFRTVYDELGLEKRVS